MLETLELQSGGQPSGSVIWLHGLGADGHDFEPIVPQLRGDEDRPLRFVFPHAPMRPVTINNHAVMRAWYDIKGFDLSQKEDRDGTTQSVAQVTELIEREEARGIASENIVLAGFSQGGAIALHLGLRFPRRLAGIIALSTYLPFATEAASERTEANAQTPIMLGHGTHDPVVPIGLGHLSHERLSALGYPVRWYSYPMPHSVCPAQIQDIARWLRERFD